MNSLRRYCSILLFFSFCFLLMPPLMVNSSPAGPVDLNGNFLGSKNSDNTDRLIYKMMDEVYPKGQFMVKGFSQSTMQLIQSSNADIFSPYTSIYVGSWPESVAIGDVNSDGRNDVVLATSSYFDEQNDYQIFVFLQEKTGNLSSPVKYSAGNGESVDIADINDDGKNDVVVTASNAIGVFLQNVNGALDPMIIYPSNHSSHSNTYKVRTGDFNNDGLIDVVSIDWGTQSHNVDVYLQNDNNKLNEPVSYVIKHGGYDDLEVEDVNNDGLTDIIVMSGQSYVYDNIGILLQNSSGTFDSPVYYDTGINRNTSGVAVGDIDDDSLQDIIVTYGGNRPSSFIAAFLQNDSGKLEPCVSYSSYDCPESVEIADVNHDGRNDVIVLHGGWNKMGVYLQGLEGTLNDEMLYQIPYASHYNPHGLAIGDINGDGSNDIAIADYNHGLVLLYNNTIVYEPPVADAGPDRIEYDNFILDAGRSFDPDGYIVSYIWKITHKDDPMNTITAEGEVVFLSDIKQGFYNVTLTVTDDKGLSDLDRILLAVKGQMPQCEYTHEDVDQAYSKGYNDGKLENQATYDTKSNSLHIPSVIIDGDVQEWEMRRRGRSHNFMLTKDLDI